MKDTELFRIYVACLSSYNSGILYGKWLDVEGKSGEELREEITELLKASPVLDAEEWAIHDTEGFGSYQVSEWHDLEELCEHVEALKSTHYDSELIEGVCEDRNIGAREAIQYLDDNYAGEHDSAECWAENFLEETGGLESVPKHLRGYIDFQAYARDAELNGEIFLLDTTSCRGVHVIWQN